jgi:hypothetical protein
MGYRERLCGNIEGESLMRNERRAPGSVKASNAAAIVLAGVQYSLPGAVNLLVIWKDDPQTQ